MSPDRDSALLATLDALQRYIDDGFARGMLSDMAACAALQRLVDNWRQYHRDGGTLASLRWDDDLGEVIEQLRRVRAAFETAMVVHFVEEELQ